MGVQVPPRTPALTKAFTRQGRGPASLADATSNETSNVVVPVRVYDPLRAGEVAGVIGPIRSLNPLSREGFDEASELTHHSAEWAQVAGSGGIGCIVIQK